MNNGIDIHKVTLVYANFESLFSLIAKDVSRNPNRHRDSLSFSTFFHV